MSRSEVNSSVQPAQQRMTLLLDLAISLAQASGGAIWLNGENKQPDLFTQKGLGQLPLDQVQSNWRGHAEKLVDVIKSSQPQTLTARFEADQSAPQALQLLLLPMRDGDSSFGILELFLPERDSPSIQKISQQVLDLLKVSTDLFSENSQDLRQFAVWLMQINNSLNLKENAFALANETRTWSNWDRVSLAVQQGAGYRVKAVSGLETFDRRSGAVREIESLVNDIKQERRLLVTDQEAISEPQQKDSPAIKRILEYATRVKGVRALVLPLVAQTDQTCGFLVFENFHENTASLSPQRVQQIQLPATKALRHALDYERANTSPFLRGLRRVTSQAGFRTISVFILVAGLVTAICLIPTDLVITANGTLQPEQRYDLYALSDGIIQEIHTKHGQQVTANQQLITIHSPELEYELNRLTGEVDTLKQQMTDLETLRSDPRRSSTQSSPAELAAKIEELKTVQTSLESQIRILNQQIKSLTIISPIDGQILTWNIDALLADRPVKRTDRLLTVANLKGDWVLDMQVDHRDIGPVVESHRANRIEVNYVTANAPETTQQAVIDSLAPALSVKRETGSVLEIRAEVNKVQLADSQPGTTVIARIKCGRHAIGYVWFRRFINRAQVWWALW